MNLDNKIDRQRIEREFAEVINKNSLENGSDTPDYILAEYLVNCLDAFNRATKERKRHFGHKAERVITQQYDRHDDGDDLLTILTTMK